MELRHLNYFVAVAQELHFGRAAVRLHISQPSLSQQIRNLESELDVTLFWRNKRRVELTHAGRVFLLEALQILARAKSAIQAARRADLGEIGPLTVACGPIASCVGLPLLLRRYRARYPNVDIILQECLMRDVVSAVEDGTADIGLTVRYFHSETLKRKTVLKLPLQVVVPVGHALARAGRISLRQLVGERFILFPQGRGSGFYEHTMAICQRSGFTPKVLGGVAHIHTLLLMVAAGYGVSLVPVLPKTAERRGYTCIRLAEPYATVEICMAWRANERSPLLTPFMRAVTACYREEQRRLLGLLSRTK